MCVALHAALASNDGIALVGAPLTSPTLGHISLAIVPIAMAFILLRFWPLNPELLNSHSFSGCSRVRSAPRRVTVS
jgi:hypothetical protein